MIMAIEVPPTFLEVCGFMTPKETTGLLEPLTGQGGFRTKKLKGLEKLPKYCKAF
jgi:hypothetical protein